MTDQNDCQLYLVTPPDFDPAAFAPLVEEALRDIVQRHETAFVINGHVKLAAYLGCDGVHLESASAKDVKAAKTALGEDAIVGVSARTSKHDAMVAAEAGADYVSFGPIFDTATKGLPADPAALESLSWWAEMMEVPCVAVGGVTPENAGKLAADGADFVCAVSAVWDHPDGPGAGVAAFTKALKAAR
jgi:thiamine-phosphate pyrophosphorylase